MKDRPAPRRTIAVCFGSRPSLKRGLPMPPRLPIPLRILRSAKD